MKYNKVRKNPTSFLALTSVCLSLFDEILPFFTDAHDEYFRWHDIKGKFPYEYVLQQDAGYQGYAPENVTVLQPMKKPKLKDLTDEQKASNAEISRTRISVEHAIGGAKILRIVKDECRLRKNNFVGNIFHIAARLHNWRFLNRV